VAFLAMHLPTSLVARHVSGTEKKIGGTLLVRFAVCFFFDTEFSTSVSNWSKLILILGVFGVLRKIPGIDLCL